MYFTAGELELWLNITRSWHSMKKAVRRKPLDAFELPTC
jgi:hypothetical protein